MVSQTLNESGEEIRLEVELLKVGMCLEIDCIFFYECSNNDGDWIKKKEDDSFRGYH